MNSQELLAKFVFWTQAWLGVIQVVTFFISGAGVYVAIVLHDNWVSRDFTCSNASDHDKNRCMGAYKTIELYPLQFGLMVPSLWYCGSLVIWIISGIVIERWFKKFVNCETRQRHKGCFKKFHIGVVYFLGIVVRLVYFLAMCAVYGLYHNNWVVSSNYDCKLSPKIYISCFYSKAKERTALNKASFGIIVSFLILGFLELLYLCRDNYRHKYVSKGKGITEALRCEECAYFANRHLIWLKPESEDAKNETKTPLIDPEQTVEHQDTAFDGPQQPGRNYIPPEEKSKKGQPCESDEKPSSSHPEETEKSHIATTSSDHGSDSGYIQDQLETTSLLRGADGQTPTLDPAIAVQDDSASPCIPDSANSDCKDSCPLIPKKDSPLSCTKSASPKSFTKSETPTREDLEGKYVANFHGNVCSRLIKLLDPRDNWEGIASRFLDADAVKKLKSGSSGHVVFFEKLKAEHATMTLADIKRHCNGKRLDIFKRIEHVQQKPDFGKEICVFEDQEWEFVLDKIAKPLMELERSIFNWKDLALNIGYEKSDIDYINHCGKVSNYSPTETLLWHLGTKLISAQEFCDKVKDCEQLDILQYLKKQIDAGTCWEVQEETAEVRGTASGGPQQLERNYNSPEEKPETDAIGASQDSYRQDGGPKGTKDQSGENVRPSHSANNSTSKSNSKKEGQGKSDFNGKAMEKVDSKTLNYVAEQIASDWKKLGIELEVPYHVIEQIEYDNRKCYDQAYAMLSNWLQRRGDDATRHELLTALITCGRKDIGDNIGRKAYS